MRAFKKVIDQLVFVSPRHIPIQNVSEVTSNQRPLRGSTPQGERVALASSEMVGDELSKDGQEEFIEFQIEVLGSAEEKHLKEWLAYGRRHGLGQWRGGGWGTFEVVEFKQIA